MAEWYVEVVGVKSDGRGTTGGGSWYEADSLEGAVAAGLRGFEAWRHHMGTGAIVTVDLTIAPPWSPRRTSGGKPLPAER